jgi:hypothetical protein
MAPWKTVTEANMQGAGEETSDVVRGVLDGSNGKFRCITESSDES